MAVPSNSRLPQARPALRSLAQSRVRVLLIANSSWYLWNFRHELARELKDMGLEVVFAAPTDAYSCRLEAIAPFQPIQLDRRGINPLIEVSAIVQFFHLLGRVQPDVLLTWTPKANIYGALVARWHDVPVIPNVSGLGYAFVRRGWLERLSGALYKKTFRRLQTVMFQNRTDMERFVRSGWTRAEAARLLPGSGVNLDRFRPRNVTRRDSPFLFLFVGRMLVDKGLRELVNAMRCLRQGELQAQLRLIGFIDHGNPTAIDEREIRTWTTEGLVEYRGPTDTVEQEYPQADCVILPSSYREGIPRTLLEAAACGLPVIAADAPGCRDAVIDGTTGFLCRPGDIESLAAAMRRMLQLSPDTRAMMGRAGRSLMERSFSQDIVFEAYREAIDFVTQKGRRHRRSEP